MTIEDARSRCWAEVSLDILRENYISAQYFAKDAFVLPVVKADAYGFGTVAVAETLLAEGARLFAVATAEEALRLREKTGADVLILGLSGSDGQIRRAVDEGIRFTAYSIEQVRRIACIAGEANTKAILHVKVDSGLHRLGFSPEDAVCAIREMQNMASLEIEGLYTHLALREPEEDERHYAAFSRVEAAIGKNIPVHHILDSIGLVRHNEWRRNAVRCGAWLYGVAPRDLADKAQCRLAVSFHARVAQLHFVQKGDRIGYDELHPLARNSVVATLSCGYADGYPRANHAGFVELRGKRAPVLGLVCMDQMMVDVTDIEDVAPGDIATLLGGGISVDEYASYTGINRNDALSRIGKRVPRIYHRNGEEFLYDGQ